MKHQLITFFLIALFAILCPSKTAVFAGDGKWFASIYVGQATDNHLTAMVTEGTGFMDYYLVSIGLGREIWRYRDCISFEWEIQIAEHYGHQSYEEYNAMLVARWLKFPWDRYLDTSFGFGEGLSYASETPEVEIKNYDDKVSRFLNFLKFEIAVNLPSTPEWVGFVQIYHRSGVFGTFNGVTGASNFIGLGLRYRF